MKKALISPSESPVKHIIGWTLTVPYKPIYENYPNSCRVAEVCNSEFEIALPLFWVDCDNNVVADQFYYDTEAQTINLIVNEPMPEPT
jgi:hypothetical protein